jgi:hypothetical protein
MKRPEFRSNIGGGGGKPLRAEGESLFTSRSAGIEPGGRGDVRCCVVCCWFTSNMGQSWFATSILVLCM